MNSVVTIQLACKNAFQRQQRQKLVRKKSSDLKENSVKSPGNFFWKILFEPRIEQGVKYVHPHMFILHANGIILVSLFLT